MIFQMLYFCILHERLFATQWVSGYDVNFLLHGIAIANAMTFRIYRWMNTIAQYEEKKENREVKFDRNVVVFDLVYTIMQLLHGR